MKYQVRDFFYYVRNQIINLIHVIHEIAIGSAVGHYMVVSARVRARNAAPSASGFDFGDKTFAVSLCRSHAVPPP